jgi:hypothetical protein
MAGGMTPVVEFLPRKQKALSQYSKKEKKKKKDLVK